LDHPYCKGMFLVLHNTIEPFYYDIVLWETSSITSDILW